MSTPIKNIIFDFGGVILNIDFKHTLNAFKNLGIRNPESLYTQHVQDQLFVRLEKGFINDAEFRDELRKHTNKSVTDEELNKAWNALLLDMPSKRIRLIEKLKEKYDVYLLSNSSKIHYDSYVKQLQAFGYSDFNALFKDAVFSFNVGLLKPEREIWDYFVENHGVKPEETLFIDDSKVNIDAALKLGYQCQWLQSDLTEIFDEELCWKGLYNEK